MTDRYADVLAPLATFCEQHGYRYRWKIAHEEQWRATVRIIDPAQVERRDKVRAWMSAVGHDEVSALERAARYAVEFAQDRLDTEAMTASGKI